jgi:hypothetical protein
MSEHLQVYVIESWEERRRVRVMGLKSGIEEERVRESGSWCRFLEAVLISELDI